MKFMIFDNQLAYFKLFLLVFSVIRRFQYASLCATHSASVFAPLHSGFSRKSREKRLEFRAGLYCNIKTVTMGFYEPLKKSTSRIQGIMFIPCFTEKFVVMLPPFFIAPNTIISVEKSLKIRRLRIALHNFLIAIKARATCGLILRHFVCINHLHGLEQCADGLLIGNDDGTEQIVHDHIRQTHRVLTAASRCQ